MYQKIYDLINNIELNCIKRLSDNAFIPFDLGNTDYQQYLLWLAEGNEPLALNE